MARIDRFTHRRRALVSLLCLLAVLLCLVLIAALLGPGFDRGGWDPAIAAVFSLTLLGGILLLAAVIVRNPAVLEISADGLLFPATYRRPLRWDEIHRIRRETGPRHLIYGARDWLVVDPLPGVLAPLRWPVWRKAELWLQSQQGIRIPLHGLEQEAGEVIRSIERFRPVATGTERT
ncbi:hypothetical protein [Ovoidimarina sediminis]|uniref:hypothetical protein n=1 Tax=Ovoidimarina sediminis TaxID=3079856 RepID=UPI00290609AE|nr:hypothetical protein [Rhodophyticola sp. MJ-SS7]MDU8943875.1 hypothetical protein [Rhodophyticola sp. MJ-SS7]